VIQNTETNSKYDPPAGRAGTLNPNKQITNSKFQIPKTDEVQNLSIVIPYLPARRNGGIWNLYKIYI